MKITELLSESKTSIKATTVFTVRLVPQDQIKTADHFGSRSENPGVYIELQKIFKALGKKVTEGGVWDFDEDSQQTQFKKIVKKLGLNPDDINPDKLKAAGFTLLYTGSTMLLWQNKEREAFISITKPGHRDAYTPTVVYITSSTK